MRNYSLPIFISLTCVVTIACVAAWLSRSGTPPVPKPAAFGEATRSGNVIDDSDLADAGLSIAVQYTGEVRDSNSLEELRDAIQRRGPAGLSALGAELTKLQHSSTPQANAIALLHQKLGTLLIYEGRYDEATTAIGKSLEMGTSMGMPARANDSLTALLGVVALRRGEVDNCIGCVGPSSCIFPIANDAIHIKPAGSRQAIEHFNSYLKTNPGDLRVRWVLNLAYMTLGEYPDKVPPRYLVPLDTFASTADIGRFQNVAPLVGLISRGPNQAGGSVFDDFTGDGLPDLLTTSLDVDRGASLFVNRGDGTFEDQSDKAGLADQVYALNVVRADFDNDGHLDALLLRGGWEKPMRMSLLRNTGNSTFEDVTIAAGLAEPIATESASWGDYDNDGLIDLFVCGEYQRCRLYHNEGHGKFVDVALAAGVASNGSIEEQRPKGSAWGDFDGDGRLDLFVSDMNLPSRLYHNEGNGTFHNVGPKLGVRGPDHAFACWFWDYDNDGRLDLYVSDFESTLADFVATALKVPHQQTSRPRLYRNLGADGFRDVAAEVGLDREISTMGSNFADIDNDGFLDFYLGTGRMALEVLIPNLMFRNDAGKKFDDITVSSGTGHLQKGHGISFADWDCDGDLDFFVEAGGGVPGDRAYNLLFQNPGNANHWLKVKLVGTKTNRAALGAQIKAVVKGSDGTARSIYRTVGNNGSFGGNSLIESIGLLDATSVSELHITWPTSQTTQTFRDVAADQAIEITEGTDSFQPLPQPKLTAPRS